MTGLDIALVRPVIGSEIDRLIAILDMLEPDPDFEDGADAEADIADEEPSLGAFECSQFNGRGTNWSLNSQGNDDREEECEDEGAQCDDEGAIDCDREPDNDDEEDSREFPANSDFYTAPIATNPGLAVQS